MQPHCAYVQLLHQSGAENDDCDSLIMPGWIDKEMADLGMLAIGQSSHLVVKL